MTERVKNGFLKKVELQVEINRLKHGDGSRRAEEWAMIAAAHMGHLMEAVMKKDKTAIEKELLHVTAPLLELYSEVCNGAVGDGKSFNGLVIFPENVVTENNIVE